MHYKVGQYPGPHYMHGERRHKKLIQLIKSRLFFMVMIGKNINLSQSIPNILNRFCDITLRTKEMHVFVKYILYSVLESTHRQWHFLAIIILRW